MRKREKEKISNPQVKNNINTPRKKIIPKKIKNTPENRLSDLEKTLDINLQILKSFFSTPLQKNNSKSKSKSNQKQEPPKEQLIITAIENLNKKYAKKKEIFNKVREKKSKSLIELQIYSEKKRKIDELKKLFQEKLEENEEGLYNKEENIKKVEKRLKEVEIYIHKLTINMIDKTRQKYYQNFTIKDFLDINNEVSRRKDLLVKRVDKIKIELNNTLNENKLYKLKNDEDKNEDDDNKIEEKNKQEDKIKKLTEKYENQIELINSKITLLKNSLEKMNEEFNLFDIKKMIKKNSQSININLDQKKVKIKETKKKENNDDFRNGLTSFLDVSIINNKEDENNISKGNFDIMKNSIWDISAINAKDISFIEKKDGF